MTAPTSPIRIADYRRFWLSRFAATAATSGLVVVLGYQLYDVARSAYGMSIPAAAFQLGLLGAAQFFPLMLLTPVAGLLADRYDRRVVAAIAMTLDLGIALALGAIAAAGIKSLPLLFALAALHGTARVFVSPAMSAIAPNIVPEALIPKAMALNSIAWQSAGMVGPAAAGFLYAGDPALPYWVAAAVIAIAIVAVGLVRNMRRTAPSTVDPPLRRMIEGFRFVGKDRFLLGCITLDLFAVLLGGATALLPVFARDILHVGPEGLGQMRAAPALGAAIVALWLSWRPLATNVGAKMLWAVAAYGAATLAFGLSRDFALSLGLLALVGATDMVSVFVRNTLVQLNTPDAMRGRVSAISGLGVSASNELGELQSGLAAALLGATGAVVFGGAGAILVTVAWAVIFPELPRARTFASHQRQKEPA